MVSGVLICFLTLSSSSFRSTPLKKSDSLDPMATLGHAVSLFYPTHLLFVFFSLPFLQSSILIKIAQNPKWGIAFNFFNIFLLLYLDLPYFTYSLVSFIYS